MERVQSRGESFVGFGKSQEVAIRAEQSAREFLGKHADLIGQTVIDIVAQRESALALDKYGQRRLEGHANDNWSRKPGITVYVTPDAKEAVVRVFERENYPVTQEQIEAVNPNTWAFRFPRGVYGMGMGGCQLYLEASEDWEKSNKAEKPFVLGYNDIVRVEGDANELWQDVNYQWDGTPKTK